jgi:hypothetical protein
MYEVTRWIGSSSIADSYLMGYQKAGYLLQSECEHESERWGIITVQEQYKARTSTLKGGIYSKYMAGTRLCEGKYSILCPNLTRV